MFPPCRRTLGAAAAYLPGMGHMDPYNALECAMHSGFDLYFLTFYLIIKSLSIKEDYLMNLDLKGLELLLGHGHLIDAVFVLR